MNESGKESGPCLRCGQCCMWISLVINHELDPETAYYLDTHGCRRRGNRLLIPSRCQHLQGESPPYTCDLHGTIYQPTSCKLYPGTDESKFLPMNGCGYRKGKPPVPPDEPVLSRSRARRR